MPKIQTAKGVLKTFAGMTKEDWTAMDKKFYKLVFGGISFVLMGLFWFYFLRNFLPLGF